MRSVPDILTSVRDFEELRDGHLAAMACCEAALAELHRAQQHAQQTSQELAVWSAALELFRRAARLTNIIESN